VASDVHVGVDFGFLQPPCHRKSRLAGSSSSPPISSFASLAAADPGVQVAFPQFLRRPQSPSPKPGPPPRAGCDGLRPR
jgi:hypothetical protein